VERISTVQALISDAVQQQNTTSSLIMDRVVEIMSTSGEVADIVQGFSIQASRTGHIASLLIETANQLADGAASLHELTGTLRARAV
jgi:hypothetical protein